MLSARVPGRHLTSSSKIDAGDARSGVQPGQLVKDPRSRHSIESLPATEKGGRNREPDPRNDISAAGDVNLAQIRRCIGATLGLFNIRLPERTRWVGLHPADTSEPYLFHAQDSPPKSLAHKKAGTPISEIQAIPVPIYLRADRPR
jgi:hypothetical protein